MASDPPNLAILFADISGSTRLFEMLGDAEARRVISGCLELLAEITARHQGTVVKTIGDELMCTFPDAESAVTAAGEMPECLEEEPAETVDKHPLSIRIRVGLHHGPAIVEAGDVFGDAVNVAARMVSLSKASQIITTRATFEQLPSILRASSRLIDRAPVKGKEKPVDIYEVLWQQDDVTRMSTAVLAGNAQAPARLKLRYRRRQMILGEERTVAILGRSKSADLTVNENLASRLHARIEYRRGKFFIVDQSTNGTYVELAGSEESFLRREEMLLAGSGRISLGRAFAKSPKEVVHFAADA